MDPGSGTAGWLCQPADARLLLRSTPRPSRADRRAAVKGEIRRRTPHRADRPLGIHAAAADADDRAVGRGHRSFPPRRDGALAPTPHWATAGLDRADLAENSA